MPVFSHFALDRNQPTLAAADLGWTVHKEPTYTRDPNGAFEPTGTYALLRSDTREFLSSVSERYRPIQNHEVVNFFENYTREFNGEITHGGHFNNRDLVLFANLNQRITLNNDNDIDCMIMARTGHYPGAALQIMIGIIHIACTNQFTYRTAEGGQGFFCQYHNLNFDTNAQEQAKLTLEACRFFIGNYKDQANQLMEKPIKDDFAESFVTKYLGDESKTKQDQPKAVGQILNIYHDSREYLAPSDDSSKTAWRLWNSITQYLDHKASGPRSKFGRSALIGAGQTVKQQTFQALLETA
jgi:phage/plasmid-like protein (TIGR03299 family)